jgi:glutamyl-tRNA reductase
VPLQEIHALALTHARLPLETVGAFHVQPQDLGALAQRLKATAGVQEIFALGTCNRAELVFTMPSGQQVDVPQLVRAWAPGVDAPQQELAIRSVQSYTGADAARHLMAVAASLESLVVGEREILAQVREQYQRCKTLGLTGDRLRVLMKQVVVTAKRVYTETAIAHRPVSVVSLAYRALRDGGMPKDSRILVVGAGKTGSDMCRYLGKHGYKDLHIFNRTYAKAQALAREVGGQAYPLDTLIAFSGSFDVLISAVGRGTPIVDVELLRTLAQGEARTRTLVDLALPHDIDARGMDTTAVRLIRVEDLQEEAERNKAGRQQELGACLAIVEEGVAEYGLMARERLVERAMGAVPEEVKAIRQRAVDEVFARDIAAMDEKSREVLMRVLDHMERKYISGPMRTAKAILLEKAHAPEKAAV